MDELDHLQPELEMLLSSAVMRQRNLQAQIDALNQTNQEELLLDRSWMQVTTKIIHNTVFLASFSSVLFCLNYNFHSFSFFENAFSHGFILEASLDL